MKNTAIIISPKTRVGELLDSYPDLEPVLMGMSPAFEKLRNPVLRKTVARVATLQQVAIVGGLNIEEMIISLRLAAGQSTDELLTDTEDITSLETPDWFDESKVTTTFDATAIINSGESPMQDILRGTNLLPEGDIFELIAPFTPAPIIEMLKSKGFSSYTIVNNDQVHTFFCKKS